MNSKNIKTIFICLAIALAVFMAFKYLKGNPKNEVLEIVGRNDVKIGQDIIIALNRLSSISLSQEIFKDKAFASFQDFTLSVKEEKIGKNNPFSSYSFGGSYSTSTGTVR